MPKGSVHTSEKNNSTSILLQRRFGQKYSRVEFMSRIGQTYSSIYECFTAIRDFSAIRDFTAVRDFTTIRDFSHFTAIRDFTAVRDFTAIRDFTTVSLSPGTVRNVPHMIGLRAGITCA